MFKILKKKFIKTLVVCLFISIIVSILLSVGFLNTWEAKISDAFYYPTNTLDEIIIIEIDDESIYKIGEWPFSRDYYAQVIKNETRCEQYEVDDADIVVVAYGISARIVRGAVTKARKEGIKVGWIRPITLWPFPDKGQLLL